MLGISSHRQQIVNLTEILPAGIDGLIDVLTVTVRVAVVGVAAYTFAKTKSLITPTLVYGTFAVGVTILHASALAGVFGS